MTEGLITIILIAISLSFDSFAVSLSCGIAKHKMQLVQILKIALVLSLFQGLMPLVGWLAGEQLLPYIEEFDHWVALLLLSLIGGKMIIESFKSEDVKKKINPDKFSVILLLGFSTSIDALAVGFSLSLFCLHILLSLAIITVVTFLAVLLGIFIGKKSKTNKSRRAEIIGGIILIAIGVKIVLEHTVWQ